MRKTLFQKGMAIALSALMMFSAVPQSAFADYDENSGVSIESVIDMEDEALLEQSSEEIAVEDAETAESESEEVMATQEQTEAAESVDGAEETEESVAETVTEIDEEKQGAEVAAETEEATQELEESTVAEAATQQDKSEETTETEAVQETEAVEEKALFSGIAEDSQISESALNAIDFSSKRLLIAGAEIIDPENELSSYDGVHLMQYKDAETAKYAYSYYYGKAAFVDVDSVISVAIGEGGAVGSQEMAEGANPIGELSQAVAENPGKAGSDVIALIDTGVNGNGNVIESVSMLGDDTSDANGHGTRMAELIVAENPNAKIISIKALGANGTGDASAVYAAIEYAKSRGVGIINLSVSAPKRAENAAVATAIAEAQAQGIKVVASAGNRGSNASYFIPGGLDGVITIGAAGEDGVRLPSSNYGDAVEYNVIAASTSEATARYTGMLSAGKGDIDEINVFPVNYTKPNVETVAIKHSVSFFQSQYGYVDGANKLIDGSAAGAVIGSINAEIKDGYIETYVLYSDLDKGTIHDIHVYKDFIVPGAETDITGDCVIDYETGLVRIPASYKDADVTVRFYQSTDSSAYFNIIPDEAKMVSVPSQFAVDWISPNGYYNHAEPEYSNIIVPQINNNQFKLTADSIYGVKLTDLRQGQQISVGTVPVHYRWNEAVGPWNPMIVGLNIGNVFTTCLGSNQTGGNDWNATGYIQCVSVSQEARTAIFFLSTNANVGQDAGGFLTIRWEESNGYLGARKVSADENVTEGNSCYKFDGVQFKVYTDEDCKTEAKDANGNSITLTSDKDGYTNTVEMKKGTYWVREVKSSLEGKGWEYNNQAEKVVVDPSKNKNTESAAIAEIKNKPLNDPAGVVIQKLDENGKIYPNDPKYSMEGAEYTIKYYKGTSASGTPDATWVIKTIKAGNYFTANLDAKHVVADKSDAAIYGKDDDEEGTYHIPLGTITIEETKAPNGFTTIGSTMQLAGGNGSDAKSGIITIQLKDEHSGVTVVSGNQTDDAEKGIQIKQLEQPVNGGLSITKKDAETGKVQGDASFAHIKFAIVNTTGRVVENKDGKKIEDGQVVQIIETNENGIAQTGKEDLPIGQEAKYTVYELRQDATIQPGDVYANSTKLGKSEMANDSYQWADNKEVITLTDKDAKSIKAGSAEHKDKPAKGSIELYKVNAETNAPYNADSETTGIRFAVVNLSKEPVEYKGNDYADGTVIDIIKIGKDGYARTDKDSMSYGTYGVFELRKDATIAVGEKYEGSKKLGTSIEANDKGVLFGGNHQSLAIHENGVVMQCKFDNKTDTGEARVTKLDKDLNKNVPQGDASFRGIRYAVVNRSAEAASVNNVMYKPNFIVQIISLDENGKATTGIDLPFGHYDIIELSADSQLKLGQEYDASQNGKSIYANDYGYLYNAQTKSVVIEKDKDVKELDFINQPVRGGVKFGKIDAESAKNTAQGVATLAGAELTIYNNSKNPVVVNGKEYAKDDAVMTVITDKDGLSQTTKDALPYGTYYVKETKPSNGYLINEEWRVDFQIRENGVIVDTTSESNKVTQSVGKDSKSGWFNAVGTAKDNQAEVPEQIIRADVKFSKIDIDGRRMGNIPFMISQLDEKGNVVEQHVIVTDENGFLDTSKRPKTGDQVNSLDQYVKNGVFTDESKLQGNTGVWFGEQSARNASKGSLVYANYRITELQCNANKGQDLLMQEIFKVNEGDELVELFKDKEVFDLEAIFVNLIIHPESTLKDEGNRSTTVVSMGDSVDVTDTIRYDHLKVYKTYKVETEIIYVSRDGKTTKSLGKEAQEFQPKKVDQTDTSLGTVNNTVSIKTSGLNGGTVNAVDKLYVKTDNGWVLLVSHNEKLDIEDQLLYVPYIETAASDAKTKDHVGTIGADGEIADIVKYENLGDKQNYLLEGTLRYADNGEVVMGLDGKPCVVTKELRVLYNQKSVVDRNGKAIGPKDGEVTMPSFKFDASNLAGRTLVVTEVLYDADTEEVVINHYDLKDEKQSVHYVKVETQASDSNTGTRTAVVGKTSITDIVTMTNTIPGMVYKVTGDLVYTVDCTDSNNVAHKKGEVIATHEPVEVTATSSTTVVELVYEVDASALEGQSGVVFEDVWHNDVKVATHHDYEAMPQIPNWPKVRTSAVDGATKSHAGVVGETATIVDTVKLTNLTVGDTYKVRGTLMNAEGGEFTVDGKAIVVTSDEFKADKSEMTVDLTFTFNSSALGGKSLVVFEKLFCISSKGETEVARHEDLKDKDQTVDYPEIETNANDGRTKDEVGTVGEIETVIDTVSYKNLHIGETYTVTGTLRYKEDFTDKNGVEHKAGDAVKKADGEDIVASESFVATKKDGTIDLTYKVNSELLRGTSIVVFEDLIVNNALVYAHEDLEDDDQRIDYPEVRTTAMDERTEDRVGSTGEVTIVDSVELTNLTVGKEYTVKGILMDKETGEALLDNEGNPITSESAAFTATDKNMTITMKFVLSNMALEGRTTVVFEDLIHNNEVVSNHRDLDDEGQSIHFPKIRTTATADDTEDHVTKAREEVTITDVVRYENLLTDGREYVMKGTLVDKANGQPILFNGEALVVEQPFTPTESSGEISLAFTFDASALAGTTVVVFENLYYKDVEVAIHADIEDEGQTVYIPEVKTKAFDEKTLIDHTLAEKEVKVIDQVSYTHLLPGKDYVMKGYLVDKKTGEPIMIDGKKVEAEQPFTAEAENGVVEMEFVFDASSIIGTPIVVFESLYYKDVEVAIHADVEDEDQTDYIPEIGTKAIADDTEDHVTQADNEITIIDTVSYTGLKPNTKYEVKGTLMDKATGKPILVDGKEVTSGATFVTGDAEEGEVRVNGETTVTFEFDGSAIAGTRTVVFETLYQQGKEVAVHADIEDEDQTVYIPEIKTTAKDTATGDHDGHLDEKVTIVDTVEYKELLPGKTYTVTGTLMVKETGKEFMVDGKPLVVTREFVADKADGTVELEFVIDSRELAGTTLVVFEEVKYNGITVGVHADINDKDQSVTFPKIGTKATDKNSGTQTMTLGDKVALIDTISYKGLTPDKEYVVKGEIMDKATGKSIGVAAEAHFTAKEADGETTLEFTLNTNQLQGKTLVVFEKVYDLKGNLIAQHEDLNDQNQTVTVPTPPTTPPPVKTGDETNLAIWFALLALSVAGIAAALFFRKRRLNKQ